MCQNDVKIKIPFYRDLIETSEKRPLAALSETLILYHALTPYVEVRILIPLPKKRDSSYELSLLRVFVYLCVVLRQFFGSLTAAFALLQTVLRLL